MSSQIVYYGSNKSDIDEFKLNDEKFSLLGRGVYFYKKKESAKMYGDYIYKVKIPSSIKLLSNGYKFNDEQLNKILKLFKIEKEIKSLPAGIADPVWWSTDGWNYFNMNRSKTSESVSEFIMSYGYDGMFVDYSRGGEVVVVWKDYNKLKLVLL